ncbi:MAG: PBP1A family penicillin-binding protein [Ruminiclostridium sp.]|nr:PBP1A family penicillin-binding protein [Ruminiclostridium sp.]
MKSSSKSASTGAAKKTKKRSPLAKFTFTLIKFVLISLVALSFATVGLVGGAVYGWLKTAPRVDFEKLTGDMNRTTFIYDSKNNVISKLTGKDNKDSEPISYQQAPQFLKDAIISIEDERFEEHPGIDIQGILNAGITYVKGFILPNAEPARGGSTITQQVIKNITENKERTIQRKVQEWAAAIELEKKLEKWQILELYMNYSYFGNGCRGVQSASKKYFGKDVWDLSLAQSALLAGITNGPEKYNPFTENGRKKAKERQETILAKMLELGKIDQRQHDQAVSEPMVYVEKSESAKVTNVQTYFVDQVISDVKEALMKEKNVSSSMALYMIYNGGLNIYTTQDPDLQSAMDEVFLDDEYFPTPAENKDAIKYNEHPQAAMVILDPQNGQIKAIYGGYGKKEASNTLNRASAIERQPGSSIKPIAVYAPAIDMGVITPATVIDDVPVYYKAGDITFPKKEWEDPYPTNYDGKYDGLTSVRNALKASINVVATKIWLDYLKPDNSLAYLKKVGINRDNERYISLVLGGLGKGVNPLQMAAAYVPFVHKGMYYEPTSFTLVKDSEDNVLLDIKPKYHTVYREQTASIMADMMQEVTKPQDSPYPHAGTATAFVNEKVIGMPVAGKTGTTSQNIDKWFVGYTPYYAAATWYGYDNKIKPIELKKSEYNQALKIWAAVMSKVHKNLERKEFTVASGLVKKTICIYSGKIATPLCKEAPRGDSTREEIFIKGTEPRDDDLCTMHVKARVCKEHQDVLKRSFMAGSFCPEDTVVEKVFIQRTVPYVPVKPDEKAPKDIIYELLAGEYCPVHGNPAGNQPDSKPNEPAAAQRSLEKVGEPLVEEQPLE